MCEYQNFNINDCVKVRLTEKGKYIYYHQFDDMNAPILKMGGKPLNPIELTYDDEGYTEFQMWQLMEIFGKHLFNGCSVPFETNIKLKVNEFKNRILRGRIMAEKFYINNELSDEKVLTAIKSAYTDYEDGEIIEAKRTLKAIVKAIEAFERNYEG